MAQFSIDQFRGAWRRLEEKGWCDAIGGMAYNRILNEYAVYSGPLTMDQFIMAASNAEPGETPMQAAKRKGFLNNG